MKINPKLNSLLKYWLPVLIWVIIIFSFSAYPTESVSEIHWKDFIFKKTIHLIEYGILALLLYRGFINYGIAKNKALMISFMIALLYGVSDEFHQSFTPGRTPKIRDVIIDGAGAFLSLYLLTKVVPKSPSIIRKIAKEIELTK